jgi:hypothetical protein
VFNRQLREFAEKLVPDDARLMQRKIVLEALTRLIQKTPVDTGRARANWQVGIDADPSGQVDYQGQDALVAGLSVIAAMPLCTAYITNNVEYIERLEEGHSKQAPAGMLSVTLEELGVMFP